MVKKSKEYALVHSCIIGIIENGRYLLCLFGTPLDGPVKDGACMEVPKETFFSFCHSKLPFVDLLDIYTQLSILNDIKKSI